ncbi:hypothetical protein BA763_23460 [Burkholderia cenocepacia]|nr:hypothetical protein BA763_23460 [Burkholderia cenocepacia]
MLIGYIPRRIQDMLEEHVLCKIFRQSQERALSCAEMYSMLSMVLMKTTFRLHLTMWICVFVFERRATGFCGLRTQSCIITSLIVEGMIRCLLKNAPGLIERRILCFIGGKLTY